MIPKKTDEEILKKMKNCALGDWCKEVPEVLPFSWKFAGESTVSGKTTLDIWTHSPELMSWDQLAVLANRAQDPLAAKTYIHAMIKCLTIDQADTTKDYSSDEIDQKNIVNCLYWLTRAANYTSAEKQFSYLQGLGDGDNHNHPFGNSPIKQISTESIFAILKLMEKVTGRGNSYPKKTVEDIATGKYSLSYPELWLKCFKILTDYLVTQDPKYFEEKLIKTRVNQLMQIYSRHFNPNNKTDDGELRKKATQCCIKFGFLDLLSKKSFPLLIEYLEQHVLKDIGNKPTSINQEVKKVLEQTSNHDDILDFMESNLKYWEKSVSTTNQLYGWVSKIIEVINQETKILCQTSPITECPITYIVAKITHTPYTKIMTEAGVGIKQDNWQEVIAKALIIEALILKSEKSQELNPVVNKIRLIQN